MPYKDPEAQRKFQRERVAKHRADFLADKSCVRCGSIDRMELDHIDPSTKVDHKIWSWSQVRRDTETAKCQVLCHECHVDKTWKEDFVSVIPHGTHSGFSHHGCKCEECLAAHAAYNQKWRDSR